MVVLQSPGNFYYLIWLSVVNGNHLKVFCLILQVKIQIGRLKRTFSLGGDGSQEIEFVCCYIIKYDCHLSMAIVYYCFTEHRTFKIKIAVIKHNFLVKETARRLKIDICHFLTIYTTECSCQLSIAIFNVVLLNTTD